MPDRERKGVPEHRPTANSGEANLKNVNSSWLAESQTSVCACVCLHASVCVCLREIQQQHQFLGTESVR